MVYNIYMDIQTLDAIALTEVISEILQGKKNPDQVSHYGQWQLPNSHIIELNHNHWYKWSERTSGYGAISLIQASLDPDWKNKNNVLELQAIEILEKYALMKSLSINLNNHHHAIKKSKL